MRSSVRVFLWVTAALVVMGLTAAVIARSPITNRQVRPMTQAQALSQKEFSVLQIKERNGERLTMSEKQRMNDLLHSLRGTRGDGPLDNQGGPDAGHYVFMDNVAPDTATYAWIELRGDAGATWISDFQGVGGGEDFDDALSGAVNLGFTFPFYSGTYTTARIASNGNIQFNSAFYTGYPTCLPFSGVGPTLMPYFADLQLDRGGNPDGANTVAVKNFGDYTVIEFDSVGFWSTSCTNTTLKFEVILFSSGAIKFQYANMVVGTCGGDEVVGIQGAGTGTSFLQYFCQGGGFEVANNRAIWFAQLSGIPNPVTNANGTVNNQDVTLTWTDPTTDTRGNLITIDSVSIHNGNVWVGRVAHGVQTFTALNQPNGNQRYLISAWHSGFASAAVAVPLLVGNASYSNNFDFDNGELIALPATGGWEWGAPTNPGGGGANSPPNVWGVGLTADYVTLQCDDLIVAPGLVVQSPTAYMEFWAWWDVESSFDGVVLQASVDDGATWVTLDPTEPPYGGPLFATGNCVGAIMAWTGNSGGWVHANVPLNSLIGQSAQYRFKFGSDESVNYTGFYIDDLTIWGLTPATYASVSGHITLDGGAGDVTQALVRANGIGSPSVHPNASGDYTLPSVQTGNRAITASLVNYATDTLRTTLDVGGLTGQNLTLHRLPPPAPTNLHVVTFDAVQGIVTLGWTNSDASVDEYWLYRKMLEDSTWNLVHTVFTTTAIDTMNQFGIWQYEVVAVDTNVLVPIYSPMSAPVQQVWGEDPPTHLRAFGNHQNLIHLTWWAPGTPPEQEVSWDNGTNEVDGIGWWNGSPTFGWLCAHYQTTAGPAMITRLKQYITGFATAGDAIQVAVFADDGTGQPTVEPLGVLDDVQTAPFDEFREWTMNPPVEIPSGSFYVGIRQIVAFSSVCVGGDNTSPFTNNTFFGNYDGTLWNTYEGWGLLTVPMQRAFVVGNFGAEEELAPVPVHRPVANWSKVISRPASNTKKPANYENLALLTAKRHPTQADGRLAENRYANMGPRDANITPAAVHGHGGGNPLDQVDFYYVYRDDADIAHVPFPTTQYDNTPVTEGQTYAYYVKAHYDNGNLSGRTGIVHAISIMPPAAPDNVTGTPLNTTQMRITWTNPTTNADGTPIVGLTGIKVYRDNVEIATINSTSILEYVDTPDRPNRIYQWTVKAFDDAGYVGPGGTFAGSVIDPWSEANFEWVDISTVGTNTGITGDDQTNTNFDIGFPFTFYGNTYTTINICSNGWASFTSTSVSYFNTPIPSTVDPNNALYPCWDDFTASGGQILYYNDTANNRFIVWWHETHLGGTEFNDFEIILTSLGEIQFQYQTISPENNMTNPNAPYLVGIENATGTDAFQIWNDGAGLWQPTDGSAISFFGPPPVYTTASGHVILDGRFNVVTAAVVNGNGSNHPFANPNATGLWNMPAVVVGTRRFTATLVGYDTAIVSVAVPEGGITNVDLTLRRLNPVAVTNLGPVIIDNSTGRDSLNWDVSPDTTIDVYRVYRKLRDDANWTLRHTVVGRTHNHDRDTLTVAGIYQYRVTAVDNDVIAPPVESDPSNIQTVGYGALPPQRLTADGNFDNKIHLHWLDPLAPPTQELMYDNGINSPAVDGIGWWGGIPPFGWMVTHYQTISGPAMVTGVKVYITGFATTGDPIQLGVFADDGTGIPTFEPLGVLDDVQSEPYDDFKEWTIDPPVTVESGSFFVGIRQMGASVCIGGDDQSPFLNNTFFGSYDGTTWNTFESWALLDVAMERAFAAGNFAAAVELSPSPVQRHAAWPVTTFPTVASSMKSAGGKAMATLTPATGHGTAVSKSAGKDANQIPKNVATAVASNAGRAAHNRYMANPHSMAQTVYRTPLNSHGRGDRSTLDDPRSYRIYKENVLLATVDSTHFDYDDTPLQENINHNYHVTAVYDNGAESLPSNTAGPVACNMAPASPPNFSGSTTGTSWHLTWSNPTINADGTPCTDLYRFRVYRDGQFLAFVATGVGQYTDTPPILNQNYTWTVTALDTVGNESPADSSSGAVQSPWQPTDYNWIDISATGTQITDFPGGRPNDDGNSAPIDLGFTFPFYGQTFTQITIATNGFATFSETSEAFINDPIPSNVQGDPSCALLPFWDDLILVDGGAVYYLADAVNHRFIYEFDAVPVYYTNPPVTFEVILDQTGGVTFQYNELNGDVSSTVGVVNCDNSDAIQLCYNGAGPWCPENQTAVKFWGGPQQSIQGVVRAFGGTQPVIPGVKVWAQGTTDSSITDVAGAYTLPIDPGTYTVWFRHPLYCDTAYANVLVEANNVTTRNATMKAPSAQFSRTSLTFSTWLGRNQSDTMHVANNTGQCPLSFTITDTSSWLVVSPASGTVPAGQDIVVTVSADVQGLPAGITRSSAMVVNYNAPGSPHSIPVDLSISAGADDPNRNIPTEFALQQNYPNPFNPSTQLRFDVPKESRVDMVIFNVMGQEVAHPVADIYQPGRYSVTFNGDNLPSGMYLVRMKAGSFTQMSKMMLLK